MGGYGLDAWIHSIAGGAHLVAALVAIAAGPLIFFRRKGDLFHRLGGYTYVASMLVVNTLALTTYELTGGFNLFHGFAIVSLASLLGGFSTIRTAGLTNKFEPLRAHAIFMGWSYFGLVLAGLSQVAYHTAPDYFLNSSNANRFFVVTVGSLSFVFGVANHIFASKVARRYASIG